MSYKEQDLADSNSVVINLAPTSQNYTISGLQPTTVYTVELYASTQVGPGPSRSAEVETAVTPGLLHCIDYLSPLDFPKHKLRFPGHQINSVSE